MNINNKTKELIELITKYLSKNATLEELNTFAWDIIDYFSSNKNKLPPHSDKENEFWYTIWLIQHLTDQEHEKDGTTEKALKDALDYLKKNKKMPSNFKGSRP